MTREEAIQLLRRGQDSFLEWFERREVRGDHPPSLARADLREADLRSVDLQGVDLSGADLSGADLRSHFPGMTQAAFRALIGGRYVGLVEKFRVPGLFNLLSKAQPLEGVNLVGATLEHACLSRANLSRAKLDGANLRFADLSFADLGSMDLVTADLSHANLNGANLRDADLWNTKLSSANLQDANLVGTDLVTANLSDVNLAGAVIAAGGDWEPYNPFGRPHSTALFPETGLPRGFVLPEDVKLCRSSNDLIRGVFHTRSGLPIVEHRIVVTHEAEGLVEWLREDPNRLIQIGPERLEELVLERLRSERIPATRIGGLNTPDGGVDIIARFCQPVDFLVAIQIKSGGAWKKAVGILEAQRLAGAVTAGPFGFGLLVTNTRFSRPALDYMESERIAKYLRRAAYPELCQWLTGNLVMKPTLDSVLPKEIQIPGGPVVHIPESSILDATGRPVRGTRDL